MAAKKQVYLYIALLIPILMLAIIMISVFLYQPTPPIPKSNFVYTFAKGYQTYACEQRIKSELLPNTTPPKNSTRQNDNCDLNNLFMYDFNTNISTPLTLEQAKKLSFASSSRSQDGFYISTYCYTSPHAGWWSMNSGSNQVCVSNKDYRRKLKISIPKTNDDFYSFVFIGWIASDHPSSNKES
jgi:hypothetical protein